MTTTPQDRQLAERINFDGGWYATQEVDYGPYRIFHPNYNGHSGTFATKNELEHFTATLLAEAREAQHKASWAMAIEALSAAMTKRKELHQKQEAHHLSMGDTESAAAASRSARGYERSHEIIRALPTPPITNEGE